MPIYIYRTYSFKKKYENISLWLCEHLIFRIVLYNIIIKTYNQILFWLNSGAGTINRLIDNRNRFWWIFDYQLHILKIDYWSLRMCSLLNVHVLSNFNMAAKNNQNELRLESPKELPRS